MIENDQQVENTRRKRAMLQEALDETLNETDNNNSNAYVRELTLRSLKRRINRTVLPKNILTVALKLW